MGNIPTGLQTYVERGGVTAPPRSLHPPATIRALSRALIEHSADLVRCHGGGGIQSQSAPAIDRMADTLSDSRSSIEDHRAPLRMMFGRAAAGTTPDRRSHTTRLIETLSQLPAEQRTMAVLVEVAGLSRERATRLLDLDLEAAKPGLAAATGQTALGHFELPLAS